MKRSYLRIQPRKKKKNRFLTSFKKPDTAVPETFITVLAKGFDFCFVFGRASGSSFPNQIKPVPSAVEVQSLNHWMAREVPKGTLN